MIEKLNSCKTREEATTLLKHMTKKELMKLAYNSDIFVKSSLNKEMVIDKIISSTVAATLRYKILLGGN